MFQFLVQVVSATDLRLSGAYIFVYPLNRVNRVKESDNQSFKKD